MGDVLLEIKEVLAEGRRYVRTRPPEARRAIARARDMLAWMPSPPRNTIEEDDLDRLDGNLAVAEQYMLVSPEVSAGYLNAACFELGLWAAEGRKREGKENPCAD